MSSHHPLPLPLRLAAVGGAAALTIAGAAAVSHAQTGSAEFAAELALDV